MWSPESSALTQLQAILRGTLSSNSAQRKAANESLDQVKLLPEIENYLLVTLLGSFNGEQIPNTGSDVRASAGLILKNLLLKSDTFKPRQYLLDHVLEGLVSPDTMVRNITGNVVTALFSIYGYEHWPQVLSQLTQAASSANSSTDAAAAATASGAMSALAKICEDSAVSLDREYSPGNRPLDGLVPQLLALCDGLSVAKVRALAIHSIVQLVPLQTQLLLVLLDDFLQKLFVLASDSDKEVRRNVCTAFALILDARPEKLHPHLDGVINYCLHTMQDADEEVAIEACEFLLALALQSTPELNDSIFRPKLAMILPVLLEKMVYLEEVIFLMDLADSKDHSAAADRDEDIKPHNAKLKSHTQQTTKEKAKSAASGDSDDSDSDSDSDSDDDEDLSEWSLRKCAASTLDILSENLPGDVLNVVLPILQERIVSNEWPTREALILAFGAVSKLCMELSPDKLPALVPFLVERIQDPQPRVRLITCWTLYRYSAWVCSEAHEGGQYASFFQPTFESILACALDPVKIVQEAACSALSGIIEEADASIIQFYMRPLLEHFRKCFNTYQRKNMIILYDCVQTFVEKMGYEALTSDPENINNLLPSLLEKWHLLQDDDNDLWPLLECMASVAATLQDLFAPYAIPVYERAITILSNCIRLDQQCQTDPSIDAPEKDFMVTSLDLVDGLIQGFGSHSIELLNHKNTSNDLMEILLICLEDYTDDVRQSAYALLGDLAIFVLDPLVKPYLNSIMVSIGNEINNRTYNSHAVYNNAIWSLGEIVLRLKYEEVSKYIPNLLDLLVPVLNLSDTHETVLDNAAVCLGRMGTTVEGATVISARMPEFIFQWCCQMLYHLDDSEKETAFDGILNVISANPDAGFGGLSNQQGKKNLARFISCLGSYTAVPEELGQKFGQVLQGYHQMLGDDVWNSQILSQIDPETRGNLSMYGQ